MLRGDCEPVPLTAKAFDVFVSGGSPRQQPAPVQDDAKSSPGRIVGTRNRSPSQVTSKGRCWDGWQEAGQIVPVLVVDAQYVVFGGRRLPPGPGHSAASVRSALGATRRLLSLDSCLWSAPAKLLSRLVEDFIAKKYDSLTTAVQP